ncbi:hypothetical protein FDG2_3001 [Candidatus Protofrankia californiensis]|uniref:Uncharacterized protein n=1 Tax=Candidatus Protofrankia californiensis TaxID=1839754 RepID=A0A1C3NYU2_9ACTN|nr:hypothetical protein FDG2_3001 [Candidatus Protofrankia californiensis]
MREFYGMVPLARGHGLTVAVSSSRHFIGVALYSDPSIHPDMTGLSHALPLALTALAPPAPVPAPRVALPAESSTAAPPTADPAPAPSAAAGRGRSTPQPVT